jgi:hypothetical protein
VPNYREFCANLEDALCKARFAGRFWFYENGDTERAPITELLLKQNPDVVLFFLPDAKATKLAKRLIDHGIRVIRIADSLSPLEANYRLSRHNAVKDIFVSWKISGIRSIAVFHDETAESATMVMLIEACLRDAPIPYEIVNSKPLPSATYIRSLAHRKDAAVVFTASELFVQLLYENRADFETIARTQRVLLPQGAIDFPVREFAVNEVDVVEFDWRNVVKRIVDDLTNWRLISDNPPTIFHAQWRHRRDNCRPAQLTVFHSTAPCRSGPAKDSSA